MTTPLVIWIDADLTADTARVAAKLFLPGEESDSQPSRAALITARVMGIDEGEIEILAAGLVADFSHRHNDYAELLARHSDLVAAQVGAELALSPARRLVLGASFTAEYAVEAAAICNPSAVPHPDQTELEPGQLRVAVSLRGIGEGHISSIGFCSAIVGPGTQWVFQERRAPIDVGDVRPGRWSVARLAAVLADEHYLDQLGMDVLRRLPAEFTGLDLEAALAAVRTPLLTRPSSLATMELLRRLVASAYTVEFDPAHSLDQRVLMPTAPEESNGMEDARFTPFVDADGVTEYRATYTAYDGHNIAPRMLTSPDLRVFHARRLAGAAARNKGMALFPRLVGGRYLALCRSDGESTGLTESTDGFQWGEPKIVQRPTASWEIVQVGNCGPPIETPHGWLALTHGVGPMRTYAIGALLLDLDDPSQVIGWLRDPLLSVAVDQRDGYVPNVVYSCGAILVGDVLWLPYGIDDSRIAVGYASLDAILARMTYVSARTLS